MKKSYLPIVLLLNLMFAVYVEGDTISQEDLTTTFNTCFGDVETVTFGDYYHNSIIWLNISASW